ncbi:MAG TPA: 2-hydroxyacyl-CoA dehydratase family protein, partial [Planctomycetota bacterium]|nr:2-hydroxyacyl-CoA dehydratase family protein [Planctomycetota bacterium]
DHAKDLWLTEVRAFRDRVEELTGRRVEGDVLAGTIRLMNRKRRLLAELNDLRTGALPPISGVDAQVVMQVALIDEPERYSEHLEALVDELRERVEKGVSPFPKNAPRVMVAGCPCVMGNWKVHHILETSGAAVVYDESCVGARYFEHLVKENGASVDRQLEAIAERYLRIDCSCFSPNTERVEHVLELAGTCGADAVVQYILQYCHGYNIEAIRISGALKKAGTPALTIETDYSQEDTGQLRTRIEALLEGVKG